MTAPGDTALRRLVVAVITQYAGPDADGEALAAAARRAYEDLARVSTPLIGAMGLDALTARAVHLAGREHLWLADTREPGPTDGAFGAVVIRVRQRGDPEAAVDGAAAVLVRLGGLLVALIGQGLTWRLLRQAWPPGLPGEHEQEADT